MTDTGFDGISTEAWKRGAASAPPAAPSRIVAVRRIRPGSRPARTNTRFRPSSRFTQSLPTGDVSPNVPEFHPPAKVAGPSSANVTRSFASGRTTPRSSTSARSTNATSEPSASSPSGPVVAARTSFAGAPAVSMRSTAIVSPFASRATASTQPDAVTSTSGNSQRNMSPWAGAFWSPTDFPLTKSSISVAWSEETTHTVLCSGSRCRRSPE